MKVEVIVTVDAEDRRSESRASWTARIKTIHGGIRIHEVDGVRTHEKVPGNYIKVCEQAFDWGQRFVRPGEEEVYRSGSVEATVVDNDRRYSVRFAGQIPEDYFAAVEAWLASFPADRSE